MGGNPTPVATLTPIRSVKPMKLVSLCGAVALSTAALEFGMVSGGGVEGWGWEGNPTPVGTLTPISEADEVDG